MYRTFKLSLSVLTVPLLSVSSRGLDSIRTSTGHTECQVQSALALCTDTATYHCALNSLARCAAHAQTSGAAQSVRGAVVEDEPFWSDETSRIKDFAGNLTHFKFLQSHKYNYCCNSHRQLLANYKFKSSVLDTTFLAVIHYINSLQFIINGTTEINILRNSVENAYRSSQQTQRSSPNKQVAFE